MEPEFRSMAEQRRHEWLLEQRNKIIEEQGAQIIKESLEDEPYLVRDVPLEGDSMLIAHFVGIDVHAKKTILESDDELSQVEACLDEIDFQSLILSRFTPQEIDKLGISVTACEV